MMRARAERLARSHATDNGVEAGLETFPGGVRTRQGQPRLPDGDE